MNSDINGYCRLCATILPVNKLINLQIDEVKCDDVVRKLSRLKAAVDWSRNDLPKYICFSCNDSLESAFEFVHCVENAQDILNGLLIQHTFKFEIDVVASSNDDFNSPSDSNAEIKREFIELPLSDDEKQFLRNPIQPVKPEKTDKKFKVSSSFPESKLTWKDYSWTCASCGTLFPSFAELKNHSMNFHNSCNKYRCTDCKTKRIKLVKFVRHVEQHRKYLKLSCFQCFAVFSTIREAREHKKTHTSTQYMCEGCITSFNTAEDLDAHQNIYFQSAHTYPATEKTFTCAVCNKGYINKGSLTAHLVTHTERQKDQTCDKCGKCFYSRYNLLAHIKQHENNKTFQCEICKLTFLTLKRLRDHVENSHTTAKPFTCDKCGRSFRLQRQLKSHSITHTDEMPFPCSCCEKAFRFKSLLTQHIRQHTGVKPYSCTACQHDFTNWANYNKHMKRRHGMDTAKRKRTPNGTFPVNPATGEVMPFNETKEIQEWKQQITTRQRPGRQRKPKKADDQTVKVEVDQ